MNQGRLVLPWQPGCAPPLLPAPLPFLVLSRKGRTGGQPILNSPACDITRPSQPTTAP